MGEVLVVLFFVKRTIALDAAILLAWQLRAGDICLYLGGKGFNSVSYCHNIVFENAQKDAWRSEVSSYPVSCDVNTCCRHYFLS